MPQLSCYRYSGFGLLPAREARRIDARRDARHWAREAELASMSCGTSGVAKCFAAGPLQLAQLGAKSASERCGIGSRRPQWGAAHRRGAPNFSTAQTSISTIFL
jgi:hypothetical protein